MSQRITQRIIPQPTLSRALQRRLSVPEIGHAFDVVSDPPPARRVQQTEEGSADAKSEPPPSK
jgi:hypothetical protein